MDPNVQSAAIVMRQYGGPVRVGDTVITMMQGLGGVRPQRPGRYAEYVVVPASAVAAFARNVDPLEMAALGLASVTAFEALHKIGDLSNRRIVVTVPPVGSVRRLSQ